MNFLSFRHIQLSRAVMLMMVVLPGCVAFESVSRLKEQLFTLDNRLRALETQATDIQQALKQKDSASHRGFEITASLGEQLNEHQQQIRILAGDLSEFKKILGTTDLTPTDVMDQLYDGSVISELENLQARTFSLKESVDKSLDALDDSIQQLTQRIEATENSLKQISVSSPISDSSPSSPSAQSSQPFTTLAQAKAAFEKKQYRKLVREIPELIKKMSRSSSHELLRYYLCECHYLLGDLEEAIISCDDFLKSSPTQSRYISRAKLRLGDSYRHLGKPEVSKLYYDDVIREFPGSKDAQTATARQQ